MVLSPAYLKGIFMNKKSAKDIARDLNLSIGTVYRALNGTGRVSEKTKQLVNEYAEKVHYQSNTIAQGLAKRKKLRFMYIIPNEPSEWWTFFYSGAKQAMDELEDFGVEFVIYRISYSTVEGRLGCYDYITNHEINGIILSPSVHPEILATIDYAYAHEIPVVAVNGDFQLPSERLFYYGPNEEQTGRITAELMGKFLGGHGKVTIIGKNNIDYYRPPLRRQGFISFLSQAFPDITIDRNLILSENKVKDSVRSLLKDPSNRPDGIYANESMVLGEVAAVLEEMNISNICLIGHEGHTPNPDYLKRGIVSALVCEETFSQGYYPFKLLYNYLLTGVVPDSFYYSNVNIILKSNVHLLAMHDVGCGFM